MRTIYETKYRVTTNMRDKKGNLALDSILDLFQDIAGLHADELGSADTQMNQIGIYWVISRTEIDILGDTSHIDVAHVSTWPQKPKRFLCERQYSLKDEKGKLLVMGRSYWVLLSIETQQLQPSSAFSYPLDTFYEDTFYSNRPYNNAKVVENNNELLVKEIKIPRRFIDKNGHLNNTRYTELMYNCLSDDDNIKIATFYYHEQVKEGQELKFYRLDEDNKVHFTAYVNDKVVFKTVIELEK